MTVETHSAVPVVHHNTNFVNTLRSLLSYCLHFCAARLSMLRREIKKGGIHSVVALARAGARATLKTAIDNVDGPPKACTRKRVGRERSWLHTRGAGLLMIKTNTPSPETPTTTTITTNHHQPSPVTTKQAARRTVVSVCAHILRAPRLDSGEHVMRRGLAALPPGSVARAATEPEPYGAGPSEGWVLWW